MMHNDTGPNEKKGLNQSRQHIEGVHQNSHSGKNTPLHQDQSQELFASKFPPTSCGHYDFLDSVLGDSCQELRLRRQSMGSERKGGQHEYLRAFGLKKLQRRVPGTARSGDTRATVIATASKVITWPFKLSCRNFARTREKYIGIPCKGARRT